MRIQDIIRGLLDMIDSAEHPQASIEVVPTEKSGQDSPLTHTHDDVRRFRQIVDLADCNPAEYKNTPNEQYADIDAVTTNAGGGVNGPKNPSDIRGEHPSMYPTHQDGWRK